jgi:hypothetical protein
MNFQRFTSIVTVNYLSQKIHVKDYSTIRFYSVTPKEHKHLKIEQIKINERSEPTCINVSDNSEWFYCAAGGHKYHGMLCCAIQIHAKKKYLHI